MSKAISILMLCACALGASVNAFAGVGEVAQDPATPSAAELMVRVTNEPRFTLIAALMLTLIMYGIKKIPKVSAWLAQDPMRTRVAAFVLALGPGLVTLLTSHATWDASATAALVAFLTSTGLDKVLTAPPGPKDAPAVTQAPVEGDSKGGAP